ncbi:MAG TPA: hypothetical protein VNP95_00665 [Thermomicrobiales bacterium]|nr:hypothetical protein [Thermomicrobiales bacterium]
MGDRPDDIGIGPRPREPLRSMARRHSLLALDDRVKPFTTLVPPEMMEIVWAEIAAINRGEARRFDGNRYEINGRVYVDKGGGTFFPASGPGFIGPLDRGTHRALLILKAEGGVSPRVTFRFQREGLSDDQIEWALAIWQRRTLAQEEGP